MTGEAGMAPGAAGPSRAVHVEHCMGTVFSIDIRDPGPWEPAISAVIRWLHHVDEVFSTYLPGSDISRLRRGQLTAGPARGESASPLVAEVLALCARAQEETNGYFTAALPGGIDPTGLVKGWAIERASGILRAHGSANHCVNGGGDIQLAGEASPGQPWRVGITDPRDRARLLTVVAGRDVAVATSGVAERGPHIIDPRTGAPAAGLASATIVGGSLTRADAYATAAFAMGASAIAWATRMPGIEALLVSPQGFTSRTPGFTDWESSPGRAGRPAP